MHLGAKHGRDGTLGSSTDAKARILAATAKLRRVSTARVGRGTSSNCLRTAAALDEGTPLKSTLEEREPSPPPPWHRGRRRSLAKAGEAQDDSNDGRLEEEACDIPNWMRGNCTARKVVGVPAPRAERGLDEAAEEDDLEGELSEEEQHLEAEYEGIAPEEFQEDVREEEEHVVDECQDREDCREQEEDQDACDQEEFQDTEWCGPEEFQEECEPEENFELEHDEASQQSWKSESGMERDVSNQGSALDRLLQANRPVQTSTCLPPPRPTSKLKKNAMTEDRRSTLNLLLDPDTKPAPVAQLLESPKIPKVLGMHLGGSHRVELVPKATSAKPKTPDASTSSSSSSSLPTPAPSSKLREPPPSPQVPPSSLTDGSSARPADMASSTAPLAASIHEIAAPQVADTTATAGIIQRLLGKATLDPKLRHEQQLVKEEKVQMPVQNKSRVSSGDAASAKDRSRSPRNTKTSRAAEERARSRGLLAAAANAAAADINATTPLPQHRTLSDQQERLRKLQEFRQQQKRLKLSRRSLSLARPAVKSKRSHRREQAQARTWGKSDGMTTSPSKPPTSATAPVATAVKSASAASSHVPQPKVRAEAFGSPSANNAGVGVKLEVTPPLPPRTVLKPIAKQSIVGKQNVGTVPCDKDAPDKKGPIMSSKAKALIRPKSVAQKIVARWICAACDEPNKLSRDHCNNCNKPRGADQAVATDDKKAPRQAGATDDKKAPRQGNDHGAQEVPSAKAGGIKIIWKTRS